MNIILKRALLEQRPVEIIYMTKKGILTQRLIRIIEIDGNLVKAYCLLRNSKRTFHLDHILSAAYPRKNGKFKYAE